LNRELKVPEAFTVTVTTQCPAAHVPAPIPVHAAPVTVPALSHPHDVEDVTVRLLTF
jgi:hypothetical protein